MAFYKRYMGDIIRNRRRINQSDYFDASSLYSRSLAHVALLRSFRHTSGINFLQTHSNFFPSKDADSLTLLRETGGGGLGSRDRGVGSSGLD